MAIRRTTHVLKNSDIVNRPLPTVLKAGEPIINTADGIMVFSGVTTSSNEWTPAGTGSTANYFEVGSNLYDLSLRNRITQYEGVNGAGLVGKFLSGTTNGFVLADISSISGTDSYLTGGTFNTSTDTLTLNLNNGKPSVNVTGIVDTFTTGSTFVGSIAYFDTNSDAGLSAYTLDLSTFISTGDTYTTGFTYDGANNITIERNQGLSSLSVNIDTMTGLTVNGAISATSIDAATIYSGGTDLATLLGDADTKVTGVTWNPDTLTIGSSDGNSVSTTINSFNTLTVTGDTTLGNMTANTIDASTILSGGTDLATLFADNDTYVTGGTIDSSATDNSNAGSIGLTYANDEGGSYTLPFENTYITGGTVSGTNLLLDKNDGVQETINLSALTTVDTYVTGLTYNNSLLTLSQNEGQLDLTAIVDTVSALTVSNLTAGRVVYVGTGGILTDEAGFTYNESTNTFSTPVDGTVEVGTGGLNVAGDTVLQGSLTVFGPAISAFTNELYVEDPQITINYNPTGSTTSTSLGAGWIVQDGNGVTSGDVNLDIRRLDTLTGLTGTDVPDITEYTSGIGYENRGWVTQLNDIVIRSTNVATPNGVRVLAEFDCLDGGSY